MVVAVTIDHSMMAVVTVGCSVESDGSYHWVLAVLLMALKCLATS